MNVQFGDGEEFSFRPWRPADGRVLGDVFAIDTETVRIDEERRWLVPAYVLGAAFDGRAGYFVTRECVGAFLTAHRGATVAMHNAAFDLAVLNAAAPGANVYDWLDVDSVYDTQLLHRLYALGREGHAAAGPGESTLDRCAEVYLGVALAKGVKDSSGNEVRLSYARWLNRPRT